MKMVALGHQFAIGSLYNYVEDLVVPSKFEFDTCTRWLQRVINCNFCWFSRYEIVGPGRHFPSGGR